MTHLQDDVSSKSTYLLLVSLSIGFSFQCVFRVLSESILFSIIFILHVFFLFFFKSILKLKVEWSDLVYKL